MVAEQTITLTKNRYYCSERSLRSSYGLRSSCSSECLSEPLSEDDPGVVRSDEPVEGAQAPSNYANYANYANHHDAATPFPAQTDPTSSPDPPPNTERHECATMWERRKAGEHHAKATHFSVGYWWCERCEPQRKLMEIGQRRAYPQLDIPGPTAFRVQAGRRAWIRFAQEAGYILVQSALEAAQQMEQKGDHP